MASIRKHIFRVFICLHLTSSSLLLLMPFGRLIVLESLYQIILHENERNYSVINCFRMCNRSCRLLPKSAVNKHSTNSPSRALSMCVCVCLFMYSSCFRDGRAIRWVSGRNTRKNHKYSSQNRQQLSLKYYSFSLVHSSLNTTLSRLCQSVSLAARN